MVGQKERFGPGLHQFRHLVEPRFDGLARWPGSSRRRWLNSLDIAPPRLSIMCGKQDTSLQTTACPTVAAVRPDFETFAETRVSRLH